MISYGSGVKVIQNKIPSASLRRIKVLTKQLNKGKIYYKRLTFADYYGTRNKLLV